MKETNRPFGGVFSENTLAIALLLGGLSFLVYGPAFSNGFYSDDYVILQRAAELPENPFSLFRIPPECFRTTSYLVFGLLKWAFGYHSSFFYAFAILLHWLNGFLLFKLLSVITKAQSVPVMASVLFVTFQGPSEATMWLTAMHESLLGISLLSCLLLWRNEKYAWCSLVYLAALFTKESAVILLVLIPFVDIWVEKRFRFRVQYLYLIPPTLCFLAVFFYTISENSFLRSGIYRAGTQAVVVFWSSLHHLFFPWLYLAIAILLTVQKARRNLDFLWGIAWMAIALLPYLFLTYQNHVPSRQEHLASMGLAAALALLIESLRGSYLRPAFVLLFIIGNIGYFWSVKVPQYQRRAAPSARLIEQLRFRQPGPLIILNYPENIWIAKQATRLVSGWRPDMISDNPDSCKDCPKLRWNAKSGQYEF